MDTNRLITIEELEEGDEIIIPSMGHLRYYKVLRKPFKNSKGGWTGLQFSTNMTMNKVVKYPNTRWQRNAIVKTYHCTPDGHNEKVRVSGLQYKDIWLVKRKDDLC